MGKHMRFQIGNTIGNGDTGQTGTPSERKLINRGNAVRDSDAGQAFAVHKRAITNAGNTIGNADAGQVDAISKRISANADDGATIQRGRDGYISSDSNVTFCDGSFTVIYFICVISAGGCALPPGQQMQAYRNHNQYNQQQRKDFYFSHSVLPIKMPKYKIW